MDDAVLLPAPARRPPLMVGATGPRMLAATLPHGVDLAALERRAVPAMEAAAEGEVAMIDELGKMELASRRFREAISALLERPVPVVATMQSAWHPFTDTLKRRSGIETLRLTRANRDDLAKALTDRLRSAR